MRLRTDGTVIQRVDVVCQRHDNLRNVDTTTGTSLGAPGGETVDNEHCPSMSVMRKLWGVADDADNHLLRLGAGCSKVSTTAPGAAVLVGTGSDNVNHMVPFNGYQPVEGTGKGVTAECTGAGQALVGLTTWTANGAIKAVRGKCTFSSSLWSLGVSATTVATAQLGTPPVGATEQNYTCPSKSFLTGWEIAENPDLMSIVPHCRYF